MVRRARRGLGALRIPACALPSGRSRTTRATAWYRLDARAIDRLRQYGSGGRPAGVSGRPPDGRASGSVDAMECSCDGGARQPGLRRAWWSYRKLRQCRRPVRGWLQSLLSRVQWRSSRRSRLLPAAQLSGRLRTSVPRRPTERERPLALSTGALSASSRRARIVQLSAPISDAGLLAISDGLDGNRPDQLDLSRAIHALSHQSAVTRLRWATRLGRVRRRRDGRARIDERADAGGAREAR